eukprot:CAMPEP_0178996408 /NCGR_PEP_ID=MMETSP0795-20121207/8351_2 /TAXON_ID=88552 /ORGANISM="Amoebophrya sp., Strain Ameob2" /LENGTH=72 /DNA_ID=CAMNT_0020688793 /DNA_START=386 /DNA_END=604 /DNA_ORIENTATION=-
MTLCPYFWFLALASLSDKIGRVGSVVVVFVGVSIAYWYRYEVWPPYTELVKDNIVMPVVSRTVGSDRWEGWG